MLNKEQVKKRLDMLFNGEVENVYKTCNDMFEWCQLMGSIKKLDNDYLAYEIISKSNMDGFNKIKSVNLNVDYPTFDVGY